MKKTLYFWLLISLIVLTTPAFSLAQTKDSSTGSGDSIKVIPVNGVCPNDYILSQNGEECVKPSILPKTPIAPSEGSKDSSSGNNVMITPISGICPEDYVLSGNGKECLKPSILPVPVKTSQMPQLKKLASYAMPSKMPKVQRVQRHPVKMTKPFFLF